MEKLQAALRKAREQRDAVLPSATPVPSATPLQTRSRDTSLEKTWESIPLVTLDQAQLRKNRIMTSDVANAESASFDLLRTKIQLQMEKNGWKRLAITSPTKSSGKTTVCANIAFALSRQQSKRTIVYELDMRRPSIARIFGLSPQHSTADLLRGEVDITEQAFRIGPNVAVSCCPKPVSSPSDLFLDPKAIGQISRLERAYTPDLVIFDLPPMHAGDDATAFFPNVDCVLLIAESEKCTISQIDSSERQIAEHSNFLGVVLNKCRYPEEQEGYGYGYDAG